MFSLETQGLYLSWKPGLRNTLALVVLTPFWKLSTQAHSRARPNTGDINGAVGSVNSVKPLHQASCFNTSSRDESNNGENKTLLKTIDESRERTTHNPKNVTVFSGSRRPEDPTQLIFTFEVTELVGIVSLLYGILLHGGAPARSSSGQAGGAGSTPAEMSPHTAGVILAGLRMLNHMAALDLRMLQGTLGEEGLSLEFRHIASYLIWYCSHVTSEELLHEVVLCVGYFSVLHADNQAIVQAGQPPTVLQQLCALPFQYFSDPRLVAVLFPTLISCCYSNAHNRDILEQELSCALLANFIEVSAVHNIRC
ncbi:hypothetical protein RRG08_043510 [Elysia crispata]|uniref:S phase cyclin A-associated protein in the endoplasmic reticulum N-terminal domain-containing protein n=1 Tax=Elysia crispata TaxID=231223 RepID=A0AAE0YFS8_9GAST|nr:hypothetical protein RRG08_043510 [Elysia crispata]